jgi:hypothetical protein
VIFESSRISSRLLLDDLGLGAAMPDGVTAPRMRPALELEDLREAV